LICVIRSSLCCSGLVLVTKGALVIDRAMTLRDEIKPLGQRYERKRANAAAGTRRRPGATRRRCPDGGFFDG